jgi:hypothetical protein
MELRYPIVLKRYGVQLKEERMVSPTKWTNHIRKLTTCNFSLIISVNLHNLPLQEEKDFNESSVFQHPNNHSCYCFQTINYVSALHQTIDLAISIKNCLSGFQQMDCIFIHLLLSIHYKTEVTSMKLISLQTGARHLLYPRSKRCHGYWIQKM